MNTRRQSGFLAILAILLIVVGAAVAATAAYQFSKGSLNAASHLNSSQAFYVAQAGLENAKHSILSGTSCAGYTSSNIIGNGAYIVTGTTNVVQSSLNGVLSLVSNTIPLTSTSGFASRGVVQIDGELITYNSISGNNLMNAVRGINVSSILTHVLGVPVVQNQCTLTSVGAVPNLANPLGKRTLQEVIYSNGIGVGSGNYICPLAAVGNIYLGTLFAGITKVINAFVAPSSSNLVGSTICSGGTVTLNSYDSNGFHGGFTGCGNGSGGFQNLSSDSSGILSDISQHLSSLTASTMFGQYFSQSKATVQAAANQSYNANNINGVSGKTIWVNGNLTLDANKGNSSDNWGAQDNQDNGQGNNICGGWWHIWSNWNNFSSSGGGYVIGTLTNPVILIVNGNLTLGGNVTINGLVYVTGNIITENPSSFGFGGFLGWLLGGIWSNGWGWSWNGWNGNNGNGWTTNHIFVNGAMASEGTITLSGDNTIYYNPYVLTLLTNLNSNFSTAYVANPALLQELFS